MLERAKWRCSRLLIRCAGLHLSRWPCLMSEGTKESSHAPSKREAAAEVPTPWARPSPPRTLTQGPPEPKAGTGAGFRRLEPLRVGRTSRDPE